MTLIDRDVIIARLKKAEEIDPKWSMSATEFILLLQNEPVVVGEQEDEEVCAECIIHFN